VVVFFGGRTAPFGRKDVERDRGGTASVGGKREPVARMRTCRHIKNRPHSGKNSLSQGRTQAFEKKKKKRGGKKKRGDGFTKNPYAEKGVKSISGGVAGKKQNRGRGEVS